MECHLNQIKEFLSEKVGLHLAIKIIYKYGAFDTPNSKLIKQLYNNIKIGVNNQLPEKVLVSIKPSKHFSLKYKHFNSEKLVGFIGLREGKDKKQAIIIRNYWYECLFKIHQKNIKNTKDIQSFSGTPYSYNSQDSCYTLYYKFYLID